MKKERAVQILEEIKAECSGHVECKECSFYIKGKNSSCIFYSNDYYDNLPTDWDAKLLLG